MQRTFGQQPRPRMLVAGLEDDALAERLQPLAPTVRFISAGELSDGVNQREWDVIMLWDCDADVMTNVNVIQFGGTQTSQLKAGRASFYGQTTTIEVSGTYSLPESQVGEVSGLVPGLGEQLVAVGRARAMSVTHPGIQGVVVPFLLNANGKSVAGIFRRSQSSPSEWWWLPADAPDAEKWVAAALARWRVADPSRFEPEMTDWLSDRRWQTQDEQAVVASLQELDDQHAAAINEYETQRAGLEIQRQSASERAELGGRRLLTAQGDDLKDEVAIALRDLGFVVEDADEEHAKKGDLLEDLRVLDGEDPEWVALVEVRGYAGGAKLSDLQRIARFVARFAAANGKLPSAAWYVVNQLLGADPGKRPAPLSSNPDEVETFTEDGGLVVDTADLFVLRERVRRSEIPAADARAQLKTPGRLVVR